MSREIGDFVERQGKSGQVYLAGFIAISTYKGRARLRENPRRLSEAAPHYLLDIIDNDGQPVEAGAAWLQRPRAGGDDYLSVLLHAPVVFDPAIRCAAFRADDPAAAPACDRQGLTGGGQKWRLIWGAERSGQAAQRAPIDDEIPF